MNTKCVLVRWYVETAVHFTHTAFILVCEVLSSLTKAHFCTCSVLGDVQSRVVTAAWLSVGFVFLSFVSQSCVCKAAFRWWSRPKKYHGSYFMPLRSTWLAAMSMTLMMKAMAKAQIRLLRTQVCLTCCVGLEPSRKKERKKEEVGKEGERTNVKVLFNAWKIADNDFTNEGAHCETSQLQEQNNEGWTLPRKWVFTPVWCVTASLLKCLLQFWNNKLLDRYLTSILKSWSKKGSWNTFKRIVRTVFVSAFLPE